MRVAIFSDVHGNPYACEAVLNAIEKDAANNGEFHYVIAAGDHCSAGSDPVRCIELLREARVSCLYGNMDESILFEDDKEPTDPIEKSFWWRNKEVITWLREKISLEGLAWIRSLSFGVRISPTPDPTDDLLVVHANPKDVDRKIMPPIEEQKKIFAPGNKQEKFLGRNLGRQFQPDDDPGLVDMMDGVTASVIAFGHFHYSSIRHWRDKMLVNVGPCNISPNDEDKRARYCVFTWTGTKWEVRRIFVPYDTSLEAPALRASGMPHADHYAKYND